MKKKLLVSAILAGLSTAPAWAQSGLTLYGNIDASVVSASNIGPDNDRRWSFGEGNWAASVWGLKGTEDLGGGMQAHFRLEGGFNSGNGAIANGGTTGVFSRMANVGLSGPFGSLTAGLNLSPFIAAYTSTLGLAGNNFYVPALLMHRDAGTLTNALGDPVALYNGGTDADPLGASTGGFFIPNSITYSIPTEWLGGVTGSFMYAPGGVAGSSSRNSFMSANAGYAFGDLNVMIAASDRDLQYNQWLVGASAPVGPVKIAANYVRFNPDAGSASSTWILGAQMKMMPNASVGVNYARNDSAGTPQIYNLSAMYSLSKMTNLYAAINRASDGVPSSYSALVDSSTISGIQQTGSSTAVIVGIQKGF